jgi:hypothetical protein
VLAPVVLAIVSALVSVLVPKLFEAPSGWSVRVPGWLGFIRLAYVRTAGAAVFGVAAPTAIGLSVSNDPHQNVTYAVWYGVALLGLVVAIATTIVIDRRSAPAAGMAFGSGNLAPTHTAQGELRPPAAAPPRLSFGRVHIPRHGRQIVIDPDAHDAYHPTGRILRVPIINEQGADTARSVQALLHFLPNDPEGAFSPRHPALAEWDSGQSTTSLDIPGNGQPHLFDVALVLNQGHPSVFEWTRHSREAQLHGYGIAGPGIIAVEVRGSGVGELAPSISDTLHIDTLDGLISAQWESEGLGTRKNWVPKSS